MKRTAYLVHCLLLVGAMAAAGEIPSAAEGPDPKPPDLRLAPGVRPLKESVDLTIAPDRDTFSGSVDIDLELAGPTSFFWLNATELTISRATLDLEGRVQTARVVLGGADFAGFAFGRPVGPGRGRFHAEFQGKVSGTSTTGVFRQKVGQDWYTFTQFESIDARRAFPCFDEPSDKVPWRLTLRIPKKDIAVSNTPVVSQEAGAGDLKVVRFGETKPLPSYLVAFGVGPFDVVDAGRAGRNHTPIRMIVPKGRGSEARYAVAATGPLLDILEDYFGIPYPYEKLDNLVIPQTVRFGAMENAGLVTYNESILLAGSERETPEFRLRYASICAHETAHQWFGDLVTLAWWNDTWLNESFATWMSGKVLEKWKPEWNIPVLRTVSRAQTMEGDTLVSARKIRQPILTKGDIDNAFDNISYGKGSAVLSMFESWAGEEKFQKGVRRYLAAHAYGNATADDFLSALEAEGGKGLGPAFSTFLDQSGVPEVTVGLSCDTGKRPELVLSQRRLLPRGSPSAPPQIWSIPLCVRYGGQGWSGNGCELLTNGTARLPLEGARSCPDWVLADAGARGYYAALYAGGLLGNLLTRGAPELTLPERVGVLEEVAALAGAGRLPWPEALAVVPEFAGDANPHIVGTAVRIAQGIEDDLVPDDERSAYERFVRTQFGARARELGWNSKPGEKEEVELLRPELVRFVAEAGKDPELRGEARKLALAWLEDPKAVGPDTLRIVLGIAAEDGDRALFERFRDHVPKVADRTDRRALFAALGRFRDPALEKEALALMLSNQIDVRESLSILFSAIFHRQTRATAWEFFQANFDALVARLPQEMRGVLPRLGSGFCDAAHRREVEAFFRTRLNALTGAPRALAETLEEIDQCTALVADQSKAVGTFLAAR